MTSPMLNPFMMIRGFCASEVMIYGKWLRFLGSLCGSCVAHQMLTTWSCLGSIKANMDHAIKFGREMSSICGFFTCNATTKLFSKISLRMRLRLAEENLWRCPLGPWTPPSSSWGIADAFQHGSLDHAQKAAKECPRIHVLKTPPTGSKSNPSQSKKPGVYLEVWQADLLVGFAADFLGLVGGFRGGRAPADFLFSAGGFSGGFFRRIFLLHFATKKFHRQNPPLADFSTLDWTPDRPWANSKFSTGTLPEIGTRFVCTLFFATSKEFPGAWQLLLWKSQDRQTLSLTGWQDKRLRTRRPEGRQKYAHQRQGWHHQIHCKFGGTAIKSKNPKILGKSSLLKWQPKKISQPHRNRVPAVTKLHHTVLLSLCCV